MCVQNASFPSGTPLPPSVYLGRHWHHSHDKCSQAFPLHFSILQAIRNWTVGRPGNEARDGTSKYSFSFKQCLNNQCTTSPWKMAGPHYAKLPSVQDVFWSREKTLTDCSLFPCQRTPHPKISWKNLSRIATKPWNLRKFPPSKVSRYMVPGQASLVPRLPHSKSEHCAGVESPFLFLFSHEYHQMQKGGRKTNCGCAYPKAQNMKRSKCSGQLTTRFYVVLGGGWRGGSRANIIHTDH